MVTDDPGILDPGGWEVIVAVSSEDREFGEISNWPLLDVSLGLTSNIQMSFSIPRVAFKPESDEEKTGLAFASAGFKWRFVSLPKWELAVAPQFTFPVSHEIIPVDGPEDIRVLGLPLLIAYTAGDWTWNGKAGWNFSSDGTRFWDYGLALGYPLGKSVLWMAEVYGGATSSFKQRTLNYQLGLDLELRPDLHLLTSAGSRIWSETEPNIRLNYSYYVGLQWFH